MERNNRKNLIKGKACGRRSESGGLGLAEIMLILLSLTVLAVCPKNLQCSISVY